MPAIKKGRFNPEPLTACGESVPEVLIPHNLFILHTDFCELLIGGNFVEIDKITNAYLMIETIKVVEHEIAFPKLSTTEERH